MVMANLTYSCIISFIENHLTIHFIKSDVGNDSNYPWPEFRVENVIYYCSIIITRSYRKWPKFKRELLTSRKCTKTMQRFEVHILQEVKRG
jgi:hypothetical protein